MFRFHVLALTALLSIAGASFAQTGPVGSDTTKTPVPTLQSETSGRLTPDRLAQYLKGQGHAVEKKMGTNNVVQLIAAIKKDGWNFQVEITYYADHSMFNLSCPLGTVPGSHAQVLELLKLNDKMLPAHFAYREADRKLVLVDPLYGAKSTEAEFQKVLDGFLNRIRQTYPIWSGNQAVAVTPVPAPTNNPTSGLVNTTWIGTENLQDFGRLEFRFMADGKVLMIDAAGQTMGTFSQQGQTLTLTFGEGNKTVTYQGNINGNTFAGNASNVNGGLWAFTVAK